MSTEYDPDKHCEHCYLTTGRLVTDPDKVARRNPAPEK